MTGDFSQTNNCSSVATGSSCTVNVTFKPTASGTRTGTLTVTSNANNSPATVGLTGSGIGATTNLALGATMTASGSTQSYVPSNTNDGNTSTYWESTNNAFPQWLEADLGSAQTVGSITLDLPPSSSWATRTQTLSVQGSTDGSTWTTLAGSANYTFDPSTGNTVTISLPSAVSERYLRLNFTANTGWPAGQVSEFEIFPGGAGGSGSGGGGGSTNLALNQLTSASGYTQTYVPGNATDGNTSTYWESTNSAFPQWLQVDLGAAKSFSRIVLDLPPSSLVEHPDPDAVRPGQHRRVELHHDRRVGQLHLQPLDRQHGHDHLPVGQRPVRAAELHRQHRVARRAGLGVPGLDQLTRTKPARRGGGYRTAVSAPGPFTASLIRVRAEI